MSAVRWRYALAFAATYVAWFAVYQAVGWYAATLPAHDLSIPLDRALPFAPGAVWIYQLCYLFPLLPLLTVHDPRRLDRALLAVVLATVAAVACYLWFPVAVRRPALGETLAERVLALEYRADFGEGANNLPSLHVTFAWLVVLACRGWMPGAAWAVLPLVASGISLSTLFVKMHLVADIVAGAALAPAAWMAAGRLLPRAVPEWSPPGAGPGLLARRAALPAVVGVAAMLALRAAQEALQR